VIEFANAGHAADRIRASLRNAPAAVKRNADRWLIERGQAPVFGTAANIEPPARPQPARRRASHRMIVAAAPGFGRVRGEREMIAPEAWHGVVAESRAGRPFGIRLGGHHGPLVVSSRQCDLEVDPVIGLVVTFDEPAGLLHRNAGCCSITFRRLASETRWPDGGPAVRAITAMELSDISLLPPSQSGAYPAARYARCSASTLGLVDHHEAAEFRHGRREAVRRQHGVR